MTHRLTNFETISLCWAARCWREGEERSRRFSGQRSPAARLCESDWRSTPALRQFRVGFRGRVGCPLLLTGSREGRDKHAHLAGSLNIQRFPRVLRAHRRRDQSRVDRAERLGVQRAPQVVVAEDVPGRVGAGRRNCQAAALLRRRQCRRASLQHSAVAAYPLPSRRGTAKLPELGARRAVFLATVE